MLKQLNKVDLRLRNQMTFYMKENSSKFNDLFFKWLAKDDCVKFCIFTLTKKAFVKMQLIFKKAILIAIFAKKRNREKIASKERNRKKIASKNTAFESKNAHDNKRMNENINNFFAKKAANKDCVKKICKTICCLQKEINA